MAVSGSYDWEESRTNVIKAALQLIGGVGLGETVGSDANTQAVLILNAVLKHMHTLGMPLWALEIGYVLPTTETSTISLGPSGGHATLSYTHTYVATAASSGATTVEVDSISGISNGDYIGVECDDGTVHWTTVNGSPSGVTVTLTTALDDDVAVDNHVYVYTTKLMRPLKVHSARRRLWHSTDPIDTPLTLLTREEYLDLSSKDQASQPVQFYYDAQLTNGDLYVWPRFETGDNLIVITFQRPFNDMDADANTFDFPAEWSLPIIWRLAWALAPFYGIDAGERKALLMEAQALLKDVADWDQEEGSIRFRPKDQNGW